MGIIPSGGILNHFLEAYDGIGISRHLTPERNKLQARVAEEVLVLLEKLVDDGYILPKKGSYLDAGCGTGFGIPVFAEYIYRMFGERVTFGIDINKDSLNEARRLWKKLRSHYRENEGSNSISSYMLEEAQNLASFDSDEVRFSEYVISHIRRKWEELGEIRSGIKTKIGKQKDGILEKLVEEEAKKRNIVLNDNKLTIMGLSVEKKGRDKTPYARRPDFALIFTNQVLHWLNDKEKSKFLEKAYEKSKFGAVLAGNISSIGSGMPLIPAYLKTLEEIGVRDITSNPGGYLRHAYNTNPIGSTRERDIRQILNESGWYVEEGYIKTVTTEVKFDDPIEYFRAAKEYGRRAFEDCFGDAYRKDKSHQDRFWAMFEENFRKMLKDPDNPLFANYIPKDMGSLTWDAWEEGTPWVYHQVDVIFLAKKQVIN
ncbi:MAG: hypothetical protein NDI94_02325 [Candidatus Woesearchaeota archaeon]|nr:hypothetical protein [Candidatus Woesearchaeota archaeon]